jgi:hypothetical protein
MGRLKVTEGAAQDIDIEVYDDETNMLILEQMHSTLTESLRLQKINLERNYEELSAFFKCHNRSIR